MSSLVHNGRGVWLSPPPFGLTYRVERHGDVFVVQDDREVAGYGVDGRRIWKRQLVAKMAFVNERISIAPTADGIDVMEVDLALGDFRPRLRLDGTMKYIGAHAATTEELVFFATDERTLWAIDPRRFEVVQRHILDGNHLLKPIVSAKGVHVAAVDERSTTIFTLDRITGAVTGSHRIDGAAHAMTAGIAGITIDTVPQVGRRSERIAFRPDAPAVMLVGARAVDRRNPTPAIDRPKTVAHPAFLEVRSPPVKGPDGRHGVIVPKNAAPNEPERSGYHALLALLGAQSEVLPLLVANGDRLTMGLVGLTLRDPRIRWSGSTGRDPCLLDLAQAANGDSIAAYWYPAAPSRSVRVVRVDGSGDVHWLSDDFDRWFASVLHEARPGAARFVVKKLGLPEDFARAIETEIPPAWFALAHLARFDARDAERAIEAGDLEGAERMLVAAKALASAKTLAEIYARLDWPHHPAVVLETW